MAAAAASLLVASIVAATGDGLGAWTIVRRAEVESGGSVVVEAPAAWRRTDGETIVRVVPEAGGRARLAALAPGAARIRLAGETEAIEILLRVSAPPAATRPSAPESATPGVSPAPILVVPPPPLVPAENVALPPAPEIGPPASLARYLRPPGAAPAETDVSPPSMRVPAPWVHETGGGENRPGAPTEEVGPLTGPPPSESPGDLARRLAPVLPEGEGIEAPRGVPATGPEAADVAAALDLLDRRLVEAGAAALDSAVREAGEPLSEAASYKAAEALVLRGLRLEEEAQRAHRAREEARAAAARAGSIKDARAAAEALRRHLDRFPDGAYAPSAMYALGTALHLADRVGWGAGEEPAGAEVGGAALAAYLGVQRRYPASLVADDAALGVARYFDDLGRAHRAAGREPAALEAFARAETEYRAVLARFPARAAADDALAGLALLLETAIGDRVAALEAWERLAATDSPLAARAAERVATLRVRYISGRTPPPIR